MKMTASVTPAYGRDYKSAQAAAADWESGKDFIYVDYNSAHNGRYCSKSDFPKSQALKLRYSKLTRVVWVYGNQ